MAAQFTTSTQTHVHQRWSIRGTLTCTTVQFVLVLVLAMPRVTLNNASDYQTNWLYRTLNLTLTLTLLPSPLVS